MTNAPRIIEDWCWPSDIEGVRIWVLDSAGSPRTTEEIVRRLLADHLDIPADQLRIEKDLWGQPRVTLRDEVGMVGQVEISIAHAGSFLAFGVADGRKIGIDIEIIADEHDDEALARDFLTPAEYAQLLDLPAAERREAIYEFWTAKEAYLKAVGLGLAIGMTDIEMTRLDCRSLRLDRVYQSPELARGWLLRHQRLTLDTHDLLLAVALQH